MERLVEVTMLVRVTTDDAKFTEAFMKEFRGSFFPLYDVEDHVEHIAQLEAREILSEDFTEGYGPLKDFGIKAEVVNTEIGIVEDVVVDGDGDGDA